MQFSVKQRDGPARIGELVVDNSKIITPNILYTNTSRFIAPRFADFLLVNKETKEKKPALSLLKIKSNKKKDSEYCIISSNEDKDASIKDDYSFFILENAYQLFLQSKKFVNFIVELREKIGYQKMIYLPSIADPTSFALLTYLGIDFFDSTSAILAARKNILFFPDGKYNKEELNELPCNCPVCNKFKGKTSDMNFQNILDHNYYMITNEIKHVRNAILQKNLRSLVEKRIKADPHLTAILRYLDKNHYSFLEKRTPVTSKQKILATSKESLVRPEIKRFQERIITRYKKPSSAKILLLLPCSAKKPYSFSKSHKFFRERLLSSKNPQVVHELIITSPIGLVPRELELMYPAASYDIPVTGVWDEDEKKMIRNLLFNYLKINKYDKIIAHLPEEIITFITNMLEKPVITCDGNPTSKKSLDSLSKALKTNTDKYDKIKNQERTIEDIQGVASYQFGIKTAEKLLKDCIIKGKYPYQKIFHENTQLGMITKERGLISLTLNGGEKLFSSKKYFVEIYNDFTLKGSVFAPGIKNADEKIRIGDEVIVLKNKEMVAVGVAQMNGDEMGQLNFGEAVKVRHKI